MVASKALFFNTAALTVVLSLFFSPLAQAKKENNDLMPFAIIGALASFGLACSQGKDPCTLSPNLNTNALTFSTDIGADRTTEQLRISIGADWNENVYDGHSWEVVGRLEGSLQKWWSILNNPKNHSGYILGITPVFHYQLKNKRFTPFIEMGGGPYLLNNIVIENEYKSTQFQFGSIFGLGIKHQQFEISYRYLHISNAGIEMPNPGTDFHSLHIAYSF
ncbi:probable signal peptide protein [hydrothermal vent metagenome]|uniref:Probable signal peptide protein n=1 Tax=hydrothermal vent metagenome TaxID=652676 RepID=A0A3B0W4D2_9ZZZZ